MLSFTVILNLQHTLDQLEIIQINPQSVTKNLRLTREIMQYGKSFIAIFEDFLASIKKIDKLVGGMDARLLFYMKFRHFPNIS